MILIDKNFQPLLMNAAFIRICVCLEEHPDGRCLPDINHFVLLLMVEWEKLKDAIQIHFGKLKKKVKYLAPSEGMSRGDMLRHLLVRNAGIKECVFHFSVQFLQLFLERN